MLYRFLSECIYQTTVITLIICFLPEIIKYGWHILKRLKVKLPSEIYRKAEEITAEPAKLKYKKGMVLISTVVSFVFFFKNFDMVVKSFYQETSDFYEKNLVFSKFENIRFDKKKNIVFLTVESMENTFKNKDFFGANLIPDLEETEKGGIQFSEYINGYATDFTQGATIAFYTGIQPYVNLLRFVNSGFNGFSPIKSYRALGNILKENGYNTSVVIPGDAKFAATGFFLKECGIDEITDQKEISKLYANKNTKYNWGYDDKTVIETLKNKITELSKMNKPFFIHAYTIDTHFNQIQYKPDCDNVAQICNEPYKRLIYNTNKIVADFIKWLKKQPVYENTVVIIVGDHLRMGNNFSMPETRTIYNLFLNCPEPETTNRKFSQIDLFPTILEASGAEVNQHRLGLGTSVFSNEKTLLERYSEEFLDKELRKNDKLKNYIWLHKKQKPAGW